MNTHVLHIRISFEGRYLSFVFSLAKDLNDPIEDEEFPDRKSSMGDCLKFWLDSIHGSEAEGSILAETNCYISRNI
jgi:hypothetical protein